MKKMLVITGIFSAVALTSFTACSTKRTAKNTEPMPAPTPVVESSTTTTNTTTTYDRTQPYPSQRVASLGASSSGRSR